MTVPTFNLDASAAHDTPTIEAVSSLSELRALLAWPRAAGELLTVRLEGAAAEQVFGETMAVRVVADGEAVSA
ncbi:hypothetical protein ACP6C7_03985 [Mycolicibacterium septicum]|uniref:Uncharacterized protein n=1 Tax=Mycolicibacterium septicum TaxID=98668 RepID=A0ABW9LPT7_9MYCO